LNDKDCNSSNAVLPYIKISKGLPFLFLKSLQGNRFVYLECERINSTLTRYLWITRPTI